MRSLKLAATMAAFADQQTFFFTIFNVWLQISEDATKKKSLAVYQTQEFKNLFTKDHDGAQSSEWSLSIPSPNWSHIYSIPVHRVFDVC